MSHIKYWYVANDMVIEVSGLVDEITNLPIDDATVLATLNDSEGVPVTGIVWPVTLPFISSGLYRAIVDQAAAVVAESGYTLDIVVSTPGNTDAQWECKVGGEKRTC